MTTYAHRMEVAKTRQQAREAHQTTYESQMPCPRGHTTARYVVNSQCVECARLSGKRANEAGLRKTYQKDYYERNKAHIVERNKKAIALWRITPAGRAVDLVGAARRRAKKFGWPFDLEPSDVEFALKRGTCTVTGIPFIFDRAVKEHRMGPWSPSIDRLDASKGYVKGNIQVVCWALNAARNQWGDDVLKVLAEALWKKAHEQHGNQDSG